MLAVQETGADGQKSECGQIGMIGRGDKGIGGQLLANEFIEGHVLVQSTDGPVPIGIGEWIGPAFSTRKVAFGVGVSGKIQPMSPPSLSKPGRS